MTTPTPDTTYPRAEAGHLAIVGRDKSPCPYHDGWCAYDGTEPDRCKFCHATLAARDHSGCEGSMRARFARHEREAIKYAARRANVSASAPPEGDCT
jgi:hypothetical protein